MKRAVLTIILTLAIPAICQGSSGIRSCLELQERDNSNWDAYHLALELEWRADTKKTSNFDLALDIGDSEMTMGSLDHIHGGIPVGEREAPDDMVSMVSYIWAQMFGGVDVVAEAKEFARQIRRRSRFGEPRPRGENDPRSQWRFIVSCRVDERTEIAASFRNRGRLFGDGELSLEVNALDPVSEEVGLTMAYGGGEFDLRADRMALTETAEAKLVVKF